MQILAGKIPSGKNYSGKTSVALLFGALFVIAVIFAAYLAAGPFLTMQRIQTGLNQSDPQILENNIDFDSLRTSIKSQLNAQMEQTADQALGAGSSNPLASLAKMFLSQAVDKIVDHSLTPQGLAYLMRGKTHPQPDNSTGNNTSNTTDKAPVPESTPPAQPEPARTGPGQRDRQSILDQAEMSFDSASQCSFWVTNNEGKKTRIIFTRHGLRWKLSDIRLPDTPPPATH